MIFSINLLVDKPPQTVIYEVNERAFSRQGGFKGVEERLDDIQKLGATTIWLMPINPVGKLNSAGGLGSPYAVQDYTAVNPEFGTEDDFTRLVQAAHRRNLKVVIDWVADHTAWDNPWISHKDWYKQDKAGNIIIPPGTNYNDVAALDFGSKAMRSAMIQAMGDWVNKEGVDGFRCDYAGAVPTDFWKEAITALRRHSPKPLLMLAESDHVDLEPAGFDLTYDWKPFDFAKKLYNDGIDPRDFAKYVVDDSPPPVLRFVSNHDEAAWNASAVGQFGGEQAAFGAFALTCLSGGTPLIYDGEEIGWEPKIPFFTRSEIDWSTGAQTRAKFERTLSLYKGVDGPPNNHSTAQAVIYSRPHGKEVFWVVSNPKSKACTTALPYAIGRAHDAVSDLTLSLPDKVTLEPYQTMVFLSPRTE